MEKKKKSGKHKSDQCAFTLIKGLISFIWFESNRIEKCREAYFFELYFSLPHFVVPFVLFHFSLIISLEVNLWSE